MLWSRWIPFGVVFMVCEVSWEQGSDQIKFIRLIKCRLGGEAMKSTLVALAGLLSKALGAS